MAVYERLARDRLAKSRSQRAPYLARATLSQGGGGGGGVAKPQGQAEPRFSQSSDPSRSDGPRKRQRMDPRSPSVRLEASRESHNQKERNRRKDISDAVDDMRQLVPNCNAKTDKANVLKLAVEYAQQLTRLVSKHAPNELAARLEMIRHVSRAHIALDLTSGRGLTSSVQRPCREREAAWAVTSQTPNGTSPK
jgi:hypothetical protein